MPSLEKPNNRKEVIEFIHRYPDHKHFVAGNVQDRNAIHKELASTGKRILIIPGRAFLSEYEDAIHAMETDKLDILLGPYTYLIGSWTTRKNKRAISFVAPLEASEFAQGAYRLRGLDCRVGFSLRGLPQFNDLPINAGVI